MGVDQDWKVGKNRLTGKGRTKGFGMRRAKYRNHFSRMNTEFMERLGESRGGLAT